MEDRIEEILQFWFGEKYETKPLQNASKWFEKNSAFDAEVRERFGNLLTDGTLSDLENWKNSPKGVIAFILLTDQFPRNTFRGTARTFEFDSIALTAAKSAIQRKLDRDLLWIEKFFLVLPFEHSENLEDQEFALQAFQALVEEAPEELLDFAEEGYEYAIRHWEIIRRFKRFPHRNQILGRVSTSDEVEFLKQPNSSF